ncbi:uncharacterized protein LOC129732030 isoform X3 [Wyeomyia smithii]|nr:uncharacterized protein LOC129732030 isoform X3 [Wyeomyia smithii]
MDSDDRVRIDTNIDRLRKNEESLRTSITHQTGTLDAMYKFVDSSMYHVDDKIKKIMNNFNTVRKTVQDDLNFTSTIQNILYLESELMEIGFQLQTLINNLKDQQHIIIEILLGNTKGVSEMMQLVEISELVSLLHEAEDKLPNGLAFPGDGKSDILSGLLSIIEISYEPLNNQILMLKLNIPLVSKQKLVAFRGVFVPQVNGTYVVAIKMDDDILIKEVEKNWGFVISSAQYEECLSFAQNKICNLSAVEVKLSSENKCLLNLYFRNSTESCSIRILKINHDVWFASEEPNVWEYVTPDEMEIVIFHGMNGTPGMRIKTDSVKISFTNVSLSDKLAVYTNVHYNILNFTLDSWRMKFIPSLDKNTSVLSVYDRKKLFDLGVDIEDLKRERPFLENMLYSPLSSGWTIGGLTTVGVIVLISLYIFACRRNNSFKDSSQRPVVNIKDIEIIHHTPTQKTIANRNNDIQEVFENPNLVRFGDILLNNDPRNYQTVVEMEDELLQIENYLEPRQDEFTKNIHVAEITEIKEANKSEILPLRDIIEAQVINKEPQGAPKEDKSDKIAVSNKKSINKIRTHLQPGNKKGARDTTISSAAKPLKKKKKH